MALVARAKRELLLRANRYQLRWEDLEDCYSQATLELLVYARRGGTFSDRAHLGNTLELRFVSRIRDQRRALAGRSPIQAALGSALSLGGAGEHEISLTDRRAELERIVMLRHDLRRLRHFARSLTADQRLVLAWQLGQRGPGEFCRRFGWSPEKYRKVGQRARARLRGLVTESEPDVPSAAGRRKRR